MYSVNNLKHSSTTTIKVGNRKITGRRESDTLLLIKHNLIKSFSLWICLYRTSSAENYHFSNLKREKPLYLTI